MSLDLDDRQRAMLHEMDVHVWWPKPVAAVDAAVVAQTTVTDTAHPIDPIDPIDTIDLIADIAIADTTDTAITVTAKIQDDTKNVASYISRTSEKPVFTPRPLPEGIATMTWPQLQQAVATCQACKLCEGRKTTVFGMGQPPPHAGAAPQVDWLIVGDPPDEDEDRSGQPFEGEAGKLLDNMLKAIGQARGRNVYVTNIIKCRPPGNRNPEPGETAQCEPYLRRQIELLQPKIIVAMGRFSVPALLQAGVPDVQKLPLGKLRGQVHSFESAGRSVPLVATYHPTALLRNLPDKAKAWADLCLAMEAVARGEG
jgi:uracil-DNA glycosylase